MATVPSGKLVFYFHGDAADALQRYGPVLLDKKNIHEFVRCAHSDVARARLRGSGLLMRVYPGGIAGAGHAPGKPGDNGSQ
jgi:hypothetical protein